MLSRFLTRICAFGGPTSCQKTEQKFKKDHGPSISSNVVISFQKSSALRSRWSADHIALSKSSDWSDDFRIFGTPKILYAHGILIPLPWAFFSYLGTIKADSNRNESYNHIMHAIHFKDIFKRQNVILKAACKAGDIFSKLYV